MNNQIDLTKQIHVLKKQRDAVILAHLYQAPEVQDSADFVGDSLELSRKASTTDAAVIVFCGVRFMAETAKILSPQKTVLLPERSAGCPMADQVTAADVDRLRKQYPKAGVVCYVNSPAEVKAVSDICCTSSNAVRVVASIQQKEIIFVPDRNLGHYVSRFFPDRQFIFGDGSCPIHDTSNADDVRVARAKHPDALLLVHPECKPSVVDLADFTGSTAQIIAYATQSISQSFIIGTEEGVLHTLRRQNPNKTFHLLRSFFYCPDMKKTSLQSVYQTLNLMQHRIELDLQVIQAATVSLNRMIPI